MKKILITAAGSCGTNILLETMHSKVEYEFVGTHINRFKAARANTDSVYLLVPHAANEESYIEALNEIILKEKPDLVIPNTDGEVVTIAKHIREISAPVFLPSEEEILICDDKLRFHQFCDENNIHNAKAYHVSNIDEIPKIFNRFNTTPLWCRMREGGGSQGALQVETAEQAKFWIEYWNTMRNVSVDQFLISEFLPGRDFAVQSIWKDGRLYLMKAAERVSYFGGVGRPSGMSSTPEVAKTIYDESIFSFCVNLIKVLSKGNANGVYNIDLKLDVNDNICVTEINTGRFFNITSIFNVTGEHAAFDTFLALALDEEKELTISTPFDFEEMYMLRDIDTRPDFFTPDEIDQSVLTI